MKKIKLLSAVFVFVAIAMFNLNAFNEAGKMDLSVTTNQAMAFYPGQDCWEVVERGGNQSETACEVGSWSCKEVLDVSDVNGLSTCGGEPE